jgi:hypothetical protein
MDRLKPHLGPSPSAALPPLRGRPPNSGSVPPPSVHRRQDLGGTSVAAGNPPTSEE